MIGKEVTFFINNTNKIYQKMIISRPPRSSKKNTRGRKWLQNNR